VCGPATVSSSWSALSPGFHGRRPTLFAGIFTGLQDHGFLARVTLTIVTAIGLLHLMYFLLAEIVDVSHKIYRLFI
jgi:hypothetical protein